MKPIYQLLLFVLTLSANAQQTTTTYKVYVPSTGNTYYSRYTDVNQSNEGSSVTMSGMMRSAGSGEPQPIYVVCGDRRDVYTNNNGQTIITCNPSNNDCFEINNIANVPLVNLVLVNDITTKAFVGTSVTSGFNPYPNLQATIHAVTEYGSMSESEFSEIAYIQQSGGTTVLLGLVSSVTQIGDKWIVQCIPGPGWCLKYISVPKDTEIF
ncbi:MAG: hypothetical protein KIS94_12330 [Chitinophagales bacterium]|nr:hypothetical protein [Chitinophagales bacterium]